MKKLLGTKIENQHNVELWEKTQSCWKVTFGKKTNVYTALPLAVIGFKNCLHQAFFERENPNLNFRNEAMAS